MSLEILSTPKAPDAIGPYSHGTKCGDFIFTSGQCPFYPGTGEIEHDVEKATKLVLDNVLAIVEAGGGKLTDIAKVEIFVSDLANFGLINKVYADFFGDHKPARYCVQVAALPKGVALEIAATAYIG